MNRAAGNTVRWRATAIVGALALLGVGLFVGLPQGYLREARAAAQPFTSWDNLLEGPSGTTVLLKGRILSTLAPSHAGFAAYHKLESYEDDDGHTQWRILLADEPELLLELSRDGPSARIEGGYGLEEPATKDIGAYRYEYLPLDTEVWLHGKLTGYEEVPLETERVNASAGAGPAQKIPKIKATFVTTSSVESYVFSKRVKAALMALPGLAVFVLAMWLLRLAWKRDA